MLRIRVGVALACIAVAACTGGAPGASSPRNLASDQTLRFSVQHDPVTLDPAMIASEEESQVAHNVFDGLLRFDNNLNVVPDIAAAMPTISPDGQTYTFKLRSDVTFSNGDKLTAKDVLYSWNRAAAMEGPFASNLSAILGFEKVSANQVVGMPLEALLEKRDPSVTMSGLTSPDDYTVVVRLTGAAGWFESAIAQPSVAGMVVDQNVVKGDFTGWWTKPETLVGTGAFKLVDRTPRESLDFAAVPDWWGRPKPTLNHVHIDVVSDPQEALTRYESGASDLFGYAGFTAAAADVVRIQSSASEKNQLILEVKNKTYFVSFNMVSDARRPATGPFTLDQGKASHDMRFAFALAVDRTKLAKELCADVVCIPAIGGVIPKGLLGYLGDGSDPLATFDPVRARTLLLDADPDGTKSKNLTYFYDPENPFSEPTARFLQAQWLANLGVTVKLQGVPHAKFIAERLAGSYVLSRDGWSGDYNHPQAWFDNLWGQTAGCPDVGCTTGYDTKAYDDLLARADAEALPAAIGDYKALNRLLIDEAAYIPLFYTVDPLLTKPYVFGAGANNIFDYYWDQIQLESH